MRDVGTLDELYRRLQTSLFSALTQIDCWYLKNPVWKQIHKDDNNSGKFMENWQQTEAACRKLLQVRMSLLPYLYTTFIDYAERGWPPARALVLDYPDDPETWGIDDQYLLGPSLMVAPLFTGQAKRNVYLPDGDWYDFWTRQRYAGGRSISIEKGLDQIPVFVKGDSLIPLAEPVEFVTPETRFDVTVRVFGAKAEPFTLYEDDGVTFDFEKGKQNRLELRWDGNAGTTRKTGGYSGPPRYRIVRFSRQ